MGFLANPIVILGLLLSLSVGMNVILFKARDHALTRMGAVTSERNEAIAQGQACSAATERLRVEAEARSKTAAAAVEAAQGKALAWQLQAQKTLQAARRSSDACQAALELSQQKLLERRKPQ